MNTQRRFISKCHKSDIWWKQSTYKNKRNIRWMFPLTCIKTCVIPPLLLICFQILLYNCIMFRMTSEMCWLETWKCVCVCMETILCCGWKPHRSVVNVGLYNETSMDLKIKHLLIFDPTVVLANPFEIWPKDDLFSTLNPKTWLRESSKWDKNVIPIHWRK